MAPRLAFRILEPLGEMGLIKGGDTILDPRGGTGLTAITAGAKGYRAITVELEEKFVDYCRGFLCPGVVHYSVKQELLPAVEEGWKEDYTGDVKDGELETYTYYQKAVPERVRYRVSATSRCGKGEWHSVHRVIGNREYAAHKLYRPLDWQIIQGDARRLSELLSERGMATITITSPPYAEAPTGGGIMKAGYVPQSESGKKRWPDGCPPDMMSERTYTPDSHGQTPGQIGNLKDVPLKVITSPPYGEAINANTKGGIDWEKCAEGPRLDKLKPTASHGTFTLNYGSANGNIGNLPDKPFVSVMSPPYGDSDTDGARKMPESYLSAMSQVYAEIAKVSDVLAIVIKNPTRNKALRRLDLDTIEILKQSGWEIHCQHRALLFEELEQGDMFSGSQKTIKGRMSFFKRLRWKVGQPVASWEDVLICTRQQVGI